MSNPSNKDCPSSSDSISVQFMEETVGDVETPAPSIEIDVDTYNPTDGEVADDDAPPTPTSHSHRSDDPPSTVQHHIMSRSSILALFCGMFLVAAAAMGGLATRFFTHPAAGRSDIQQAMQAAKTGKGPESFCPTAYCGMTIPAGETFKLEQDLVCTGDTDGKGDSSVAITVEEGGTLDCSGNSIVQLNDEVGKAVECDNTVTNCGLAWGATGVLLKSESKVENCKVSGWQRGLLIAPPDVDGGVVKDIKIDNVEATLNSRGLYSKSNKADRIEYSVKDRYVHLLLYDSTFTSLCLL